MKGSTAIGMAGKI